MKKKYIFTKTGYKKSDLKLMDMVPEYDEDYDVADVFLIDFHSDEGETISVEAENLDDAVYTANRWFGTCVTADKVMDEYEVHDPCSYTYVPLPVKIWKKDNKKWSKRSQKYYGHRREFYAPGSVVYNYVGYSRCFGGF